MDVVLGHTARRSGCEVRPVTPEEHQDTCLEIGRLAQAVKTLTVEVNLLRTKMESIESQVNRGKGMVMGMFLAAGGIGAAISTVFHKLFGGNP